MLSPKLIQCIEQHWETITAHMIQQLRNDPRLFHIRKLPDSELRTWGESLLKNLGHWLVECREEDIARRYEHQGRLRYQEAVPLHEAVYGISLLKESMIDFVRDQGLCLTSVDLYAEEELEHRVGRFFDSLLFYLVKGYEAELRHALSIA